MTVGEMIQALQEFDPDEQLVVGILEGGRDVPYGLDANDIAKQQFITSDGENLTAIAIMLV